MANRLAMASVVVAGLLIIGLLAGGCAQNGAAGGSSGEKMVKVENDRCPIMPSQPLPTHTIPESLTREYKGHEIGFCCSACPLAWDKLSAAQKDVELAKMLQHD